MRQRGACAFVSAERLGIGHECLLQAALVRMGADVHAGNHATIRLAAKAAFRFGHAAAPWIISIRLSNSRRAVMSPLSSRPAHWVSACNSASRALAPFCVV